MQEASPLFTVCHVDACLCAPRCLFGDQGAGAIAGGSSAAGTARMGSPSDDVGPDAAAARLAQGTAFPHVLDTLPGGDA